MYFLKTGGGVLFGVALGLSIGSVSTPWGDGNIAPVTSTMAAPTPTATTPQQPTTGLYEWVDSAWAADGLWDDGNAELNLYDATLRREGALRDEAYAAHIVVKEAFTPEYLVKADDWRAPGVFDVLKLNAITYARTGLYDWHEMTSAFVGRTSLAPVKMTWGRQEWCGLSFKEWRRFGEERTLHTSSYFDGAGTTSSTHEIADDAVPHDSLPVILRSLAFDRLPAGEPISFSLVPPLRDGRTGPTEAVAASLELAPPTAVTVPMGTFDAHTITVNYPRRRGQGSETYRIEAASPHRLLRVDGADGERLELARSERLTYWQMAGATHEWFPATVFPGS